MPDESSLFTTFANPFGRYRRRRLPFGLSVSSEIFQKRVSQALEGLDGMLNISDDVRREALIDHDRKLEALLQRCKARGIAVNKDKLKLRHVFSKEGLKTGPDKAKAVLEMPRLEDVEEVQRLNRFVNYPLKLLPRLADHMVSIRRLTWQDTDFKWTEVQKDAF